MFGKKLLSFDFAKNMIPPIAEIAPAIIISGIVGLEGGLPQTFSRAFFHLSSIPSSPGSEAVDTGSFSSAIPRPFAISNPPIRRRAIPIRTFLFMILTINIIKLKIANVNTSYPH